MPPKNVGMFSVKFNIKCQNPACISEKFFKILKSKINKVHGSKAKDSRAQKENLKQGDDIDLSKNYYETAGSSNYAKHMLSCSTSVTIKNFPSPYTSRDPSRHWEKKLHGY